MNASGVIAALAMNARHPPTHRGGSGTLAFAVVEFVGAVELVDDVVGDLRVELRPRHWKA